MTRRVRITLHSFKGGTGKTLIGANIGTYLALEFEKRILLIDADWHAGTLGRYFLSSRTLAEALTYGDFLVWLETKTREVYQDRKKLITHNNRLMRDSTAITPMVESLEAYIIATEFPNVDIIPIRGTTDPRQPNIGRLPPAFWTNILPITHRRILTELAKRRDYDFILVDNAPGFLYSTLASMITANGSIIVVTPDRHNVDETFQALQTASGPLKDLFNMDSIGTHPFPISTLFNLFVESSQYANIHLSGWQKNFESLAPVIGTLPADLAILGGDLMVPNIFQVAPDHPWAKALPFVIDNLLQMMNVE